MTLKDVHDLFDLLEIYFSGHPGLTAKNIRSAWLSVLEPYSREDVKKAITQYLRSSTNFPRPQEIAVLCPAPVAERTRAEPQIMGPMDVTAKETQERLYTAWKAERERLIPLRHAAGLPATMDEAAAAGMPYTEWGLALGRAGLDTPERVWREGVTKP